MLFKLIAKKDILRLVKQNIFDAKREIIVTMNFREELERPLPASYHQLLQRKLGEGVVLKRLGFGRREDYNKIKKMYKMPSQKYQFRYYTNVGDYQRLIIIDREKLFFNVNHTFFQGSYKPIVNVFLNYFSKSFKKGKI